MTIADVPCLLRATSGSFADRMAERFSPFRSPAVSGAVHVDIDLVRGRGGGPGLFALDAEALTFEGPGFSARYDRRVHRGTIRQPASLRVLHRFLAGIWALELSARDGGLLHSAALMRRGQVFAFFGPSGSGKTTLARRRSASVVSDEVVAVVAGRDGAVAYGTPWRGRNVRGGLGALLLLGRRETPAIARLAPARAARAVLRNLFLPVPDRVLGDAVLETVARLVDTVPIFEIGVARGRAFWPLVDDALAGRGA